VSYDRIQARAGSIHLQLLLAHVLIHEITHVLQGVAPAPPDGIMKARWSGDDYDEMFSHGLALSAEDVRLIRNGMQNWSLRHISANPSGDSPLSGLRPLLFWSFNPS